MNRMLGFLTVGLMVMVGAPAKAEAAQCQAQLVHRTGVVRTTVRANAINRGQACRLAMSRCMRMRALSRTPNLFSCRLVRGTPGRFVRTCRTGFRALRVPRLVRVFNASAVGANPFIAKRQACRLSMAQCLRFQRFSPIRGRCIRLGKDFSGVEDLLAGRTE